MIKLQVRIVMILSLLLFTIVIAYASTDNQEAFLQLLTKDSAVYEYSSQVQRYDWLSSTGVIAKDLFCLCDVDSDNEEELLLASSYEGVPAEFIILKYDGNQISCIDFFYVNWKHPSIYLVNGNLIRLIESGNGGYTSYQYYEVGTDNVIIAESYQDEFDEIYRLNDLPIDEKEFGKYALYNDEWPETQEGFISSKMELEFLPITPQNIALLLRTDQQIRVRPISDYTDVYSVPFDDYICKISGDIIQSLNAYIPFAIAMSRSRTCGSTTPSSIGAARACPLYSMPVYCDSFINPAAIRSAPSNGSPPPERISADFFLYTVYTKTARTSTPKGNWRSPQP